jgi:DNA-binding NarL/FixJ family response regulator
MPARRSLQRNAEDFGFEVEAVYDGASGLKRACAKHFNLELVAEYLPDASAIKWIQELKVLNPDTHAVVVTSNNTPLNKKNAFIKAGFSGYVLENFDKTQFKAMVSALYKADASSRSRRLIKCLLFAALLSIPLWLIIFQLLIK